MVISNRDRRSFGLKLTDRGENAQKIHIKAEEELCKRILGALDTDDECRSFLNSLEKTKNKL